MKRNCTILLLIPVCMLLWACTENDEGVTPEESGTPAGQLTSATDCKTFNGPSVESLMSSSESCVEYNYVAAEKKLYLKHVNAGFNCCPGVLSATISVRDNIITIAEAEEAAMCHCNCLFDLTFVIMDLDPGTYRIVMVEPYRHADDPELSFQVDLTAEPSGETCVPRVRYPWGL